MYERVPPGVAVFLGDSWITQRPSLLARLPRAIADQVPFLRYRMDGHFESAFVEELRQKMGVAAARLRPELAPALPVLLIVDPNAPPPPPDPLELLRRAVPPNILLSAQWIGVNRASPEAWMPAARCAAATFLLSPVSRRGLLQGGALDHAFQTFVLSFLATETSRFDEPEFHTFTATRFGSKGRIFLASIDDYPVPDFHSEANNLLQTAVAAHYLPEISHTARRAAAACVEDTNTLLETTGARAIFEPHLAEPLLCASIAASSTLSQALAYLKDWGNRASSEVADLLLDLQIGLEEWMIQCRSHGRQTNHSTLADSLFEASAFPMLHCLPVPFASERCRKLWECQVEALAARLIAEKRSDLDRQHHDFLPHDIAPAERVRVLRQSIGAPLSAVNAFYTRHLPPRLISDTREEVQHLTDTATTLYFVPLG